MSRSISRRSILATSGISAAALALAACGSSDDGKQAGGSGSAEGVLKVGVEGVYKPYNFHDDSGKLVGFEIDIVEAIAEKIGKKAQYVEAKWDSLLAGLDAGQYDLVMNNVAVTDERKKAFDLTVPYAQTQGRLGVPEGSDITSLADVKGRRAAQTTTSNWGQVMTDAGAEIVASPNRSNLSRPAEPTSRRTRSLRSTPILRNTPTRRSRSWTRSLKPRFLSPGRSRRAALSPRRSTRLLPSSSTMARSQRSTRTGSVLTSLPRTKHPTEIPS